MCSLVAHNSLICGARVAPSLALLHATLEKAGAAKAKKGAPKAVAPAIPARRKIGRKSPPSSAKLGVGVKVSPKIVAAGATPKIVAAGATPPPKKSPKPSF